MSAIFGKYGPTLPRLERFSESMVRGVLTSWLRMGGVHPEQSQFSRSRVAAMRESTGQSENSFNTNVTFCPPNPKLFDTATRTFRSRVSFGM